MFINQHSIDESQLVDYTLGVGGLNGCLFNLEMAPTERPLFPCFFFFLFFFFRFLLSNIFSKQSKHMH